MNGYLFGKNTRLEDLKVEGDTAMGIIVSTKGGKEQRELWFFKKGARGWRMEPPLDALVGKQSKTTESKEKGAQGPARLRDVLGGDARRAGPVLSAGRTDGIRWPAVAPRKRFTA